jgi:hypothetical protein
MEQNLLFWHFIAFSPICTNALIGAISSAKKKGLSPRPTTRN